MMTLQAPQQFYIGNYTLHFWILTDPGVYADRLFIEMGLGKVCVHDMWPTDSDINSHLFIVISSAILSCCSSMDRDINSCILSYPSPLPPDTFFYGIVAHMFWIT